MFYQKMFKKFKKIFTTVSYFVLFILDKFVRIETDISDKDMGVYLL